jgi:hypothetical protein
MIYLTSFFKSRELPDGVIRYSAAVYQPKGYTFPKVAWTDIRDSTGEWIRPRLFLTDDAPAARYRESLYGLYHTRLDEARRWVDSIGDNDAALCCWCPFDKAAQRQLKDWGSFICHTAVLGEFLSTELKVPVWYDADRLRLLPLEQKGLTV